MFIETIKIQDGVVQNIELHQQRLEQTLYTTYRQYFDIYLRDEIIIPKTFQEGRVKCRIVYDKRIKELKFNHYKVRAVNSLKIVNIDFDYSLKYEDREMISKVFAQREYADDVLMVKDGMLTDTSYANVVVEIDGQFFTPKNPLLNGVKRQELINGKRVEEKQLTVKDLQNAKSVSLINAMLDLEEVTVSVKNIF